MIGEYTVNEDDNWELLRRALESPYSEITPFTGENKAIDKANFEKMKLAYDICMNEHAIKVAGSGPPRQLLDEFEKQYPRNSPNGIANSSTNDELTNALIWLAHHKSADLVYLDFFVSGAFGFLYLYQLILALKSDPKRPSAGMIFLSSNGDSPLSKTEYKIPAVVENYTHAFAQVMSAVNSGQSWNPTMVIDTTALDAARKVAEFQAAIAKGLPDQEAQSDPSVRYRFSCSIASRISLFDTNEM